MAYDATQIFDPSFFVRAEGVIIGNLDMTLIWLTSMNITGNPNPKNRLFGFGGRKETELVGGLGGTTVVKPNRISPL